MGEREIEVACARCRGVLVVSENYWLPRRRRLRARGHVLDEIRTASGAGAIGHPVEVLRGLLRQSQSRRARNVLRRFHQSGSIVVLVGLLLAELHIQIRPAGLVVGVMP